MALNNFYLEKQIKSDQTDELTVSLNEIKLKWTAAI